MGSAVSPIPVAAVVQPVILAGGSGTRLWPASRQGRPKQLLALTGPRTMLQDTALRLQSSAFVPPVAPPLLLTNEDYRFVVAGQLTEAGVKGARLVLEPGGRNTAPALTVAALLIGAGRGPLGEGDPPGDPDPILLVMPSDHLIVDLPAFHRAVAEGAQQADAGAIVAFGVVPSRPETGYGYVQVGAAVPGAPTARDLAGFREKPDAETARRYLAEGGHLWNSGIFMVRSSVWLAAVGRYRPDIAAACRAAAAEARADDACVRLGRTAFLACPSESIDYAVMEHLGSASDAIAGVVIPLAAGWSDLGAWDAVWEASQKDETGNAVRGTAILQDTKDSLVQADSRLVAVLGVEDIVVIETSDAVLVAGRDHTPDMKRLVEEVRELDERLALHQRRVYRPWGWYQSLDEGPGFQVKRLMVAPGASMSLQFHQHRSEHWVVVRGVAEVTCDDRVFILEENGSTYVPACARHRLTNPGTAPEIIEVQSGAYLGEDDIVRLQDDYGRTDE